MTNNMSTFKRFEKKFMLNAHQYNALCQKLSDYMTKDQFAQYTICNIYYDTDSYEIIRRSIEKPVYKEKLRIRSYGTPGKNDEIFFELKKKYKKEVFKRRVSMSTQALDDYLQGGLRPNASPQVLNEIEYFLSLYNPQPKIFIAYERSALVGIDDQNLRITFDENVRFRHNDLCLSHGDYGKTILDENTYLMEVKIHGSMPLWLSHMLNELSIFPTSFSKYGYCYQNYISQSTNIAQKQKTHNQSVA